MSAQPQLFKIPLDLGDVVYTPDWVARDMVDYFHPIGRILEPCAGDGVFLKYLPGAEWCEIEKGRDFFAWNEQVDWIVGNPPYSAFGKWILRAMEISRNILFLAPAAKPFYSEKLSRKMDRWGKIREIRKYGSGSKLNFPIGFLIGAIYFEKDYFGPMYTSNYN